MESSGFVNSRFDPASLEPISQNGATCDAFRAKLFGKLHFLKRLKPEFAGNILYQEAFRKEFETGYRLEHPNLVRYITFGTDGILMEYVDGDTLTDLLRQSPEYFRQKDNLIRFLRQLLSAVGYLHEHQVLHLDLKPDNILFSHINHDIKLVDLGCCLTDTFPDTPGRTLDFAAPEQLQPEGSIDERTDIYAIGRILQFIHQEAPLPSYLQRLQQACCQESPEERPASVALILHNLDRHDSRLRLRHRLLGLILALLVAIPSCLFMFNNISNRIASLQEPIHDTIYIQQSPSSPLSVQKEDRRDTIYIAQTSTSKAKLREGFEETMQKRINKIYNATIAHYNDSLFPPLHPSPSFGWNETGEAFAHQMDELGNQLTKEYPEIDSVEVRATITARCQNLITQVFNRMLSNRKRVDATEMEEMDAP